MLKNAFTLIVGLLGAVLMAYGAWRVYPPAGYIGGGVLLMFWSYLMARANAWAELSQRKQPKTKEDS